MIAEVTTRRYGTTLNLRATPRAGITTVGIVEAYLIQSQLGSERVGRLVLDVDGDLYAIVFRFTDEALEGRTIQGFTKTRNPETKEL
jgi:hypothetical protein